MAPWDSPTIQTFRLAETNKNRFSKQEGTYNCAKSNFCVSARLGGEQIILFSHC